jgi:SHS2 domain-containing protein
VTQEHWHAGIDPKGQVVDTTNAYEEFDSAVDAMVEMIEGVGGVRAERKAEEIREAADTEANYLWRFDNQRWVIYACELDTCNL